ncbi:MAG: class I SAM-dependent methyltransferase [Parcubacteria group bacterium]|nr:class I SAM-dependent methyltransferase [Parcubacteria group bacterium]
MDLKSTYNKIAGDWFNDHRDDTWWHSGTQKFTSLFSKGDSVLDIGCGAGIKSKYLAKSGLKVTGVDFSEKMIEIARRELPDIDFEVTDMYQIDKYPKIFDGVFAQAVLLHVPKDKVMDVLKKFKSRLKKGGYLYLAVKALKQDGIEERVKKESDYGYEYERFFSFFSIAELESYIKNLGMKTVWKLSTTSGRAEWLQIIAIK